ncbi:TonB-dependent receptor [Chitinophaga qingshengii]|uniref:TonB-dependent receptor n=2 Tax=Chitinophaga qingshengii TaxID=1569794 RepID=A0ABR7TJ11_9BACT|nr:TonB-dependent receptor [Chitinophaga qingshengii]
MKLLVPLLLLIILQVRAYGQNIRISEKDVPLERVLKQIKEQSGYDLMYNRDLVRGVGNVSLQVKDVTVEQAMRQCLEGLPLTFIIDNRTILIRGKKAAAEQPAGLVKGRVVSDKTGEGIPGATIMVKGKQIMTVTDATGNFSIAATENAVIVVSYIGFEKKETVSDGGPLEIRIKESSESMKEVVVTGYGQVLRKDLTGAIGSVKMSDLQKAPVRSFEEALAGRVAGVEVSSADGRPGAAVKIVVRGNNSVTQDNSPLYVIDGFPMENPDNNAINPSEIASIEVLKDASSTAIYGARGANGVILITTKKGKEGKPVVTYNGYYGIQENTRKIKLMDGYEFVKYQLERDPAIAQAVYLTDGRTLEDYRNVKGTDLQDEVFRVKPMQNHFLSITGGSALTRYAISGSVLNQDGIIINSGYNRAQARVNLEQTISKKLRIGVNANFSHLKRYGANPSAGTGAVYSSNLMYSIWGYRPVSGNPGTELLEDEVDAAVDPLGDLRFNPLFTVRNELRETASDILLANGYGEYDLGRYLKLRVSGGVTREKVRADVFNNSKTISGSPLTPTGKNNGVNGSVIFTERNSYLNENTLTFNKTLGDIHQVNAVAGFTVQGNKSALYGAAANQVPNENLGTAGLDEGTPVSITSMSSSYALASFLGRVNYSLLSKYLFTVSMRADGSSKFPAGNKWGYFPSGSVAWRLSEEAFMKPLQFVSNAKIRASYGVTGNNRVSDFAYLSAITLPSSIGYSFNNQPVKASIISSLGNKGLKWESTGQVNLGLDLGFFEQRIILEMDVYQKITSNLLLNAQLPYSTGFTNAFKNIGKVQNRGLELTLTTDNIRKNQFTWSSSFNISFNKNKLLQLADNQNNLLTLLPWNLDYSKVPLYIAEIGQPIARFYGYIWEGNYQYGDFDKTPAGGYVLKAGIPTYNTNRAVTQPGDVKYKDVNGDGVVNSLDRTVIGNPNPDFIGGFSNNLTYHGFDLNLFFQFAVGQDVFNANRIIFEGAGRIHQNMYATYLDRWTPENQNNKYYRVNGAGPTDFGYSTRVVEDGSYLRLKTVALGYTFPEKMLKRAKISNLRVYASAQNLLTWTKYQGFDPEVSVFESALTPGFDYSAYPRARTITFGVNLSL